MDKFKQWIEDFRLSNKDRPLLSEAFSAGQQSRQAEVDQLKTRLNRYEVHFENKDARIKKLEAELEEKDKRIEELESRLKAVHALARMRSAVITADRWFALKPHIKNAIKCLDRKEKALRGEHE